MDDLVSAVDILINCGFSELYIDIGSSEMYTIDQLAGTTKDVCRFTGEVMHDLTKPEESQLEKLGCGRINSLGWRSEISLYEGFLSMYRNLCGN